MKITEIANLWVGWHRKDGRKILVAARDEDAALWITCCYFDAKKPQRVVDDVAVHRFLKMDIDADFDSDQVQYSGGAFC